jgi:hypothetical protein
MLLAQYYDVVQALTPNRTDHTFSVRVLPGRLRRCRNIFDMERPHLALKCFAVNPVAISDQISRLIVDSARLEQLACCPDGRRMRGDIDL